MGDPYRTAAPPPREPKPPRPRWHYTAAGSYACMWALALVIQSGDWSDWRAGAVIMLAGHAVVLACLARKGM